MLNSIEHEISFAHKALNTPPHFLKPSAGVFILLINVKNADNCWHFNIYEQDKFLAKLS